MATKAKPAPKKAVKPMAKKTSPKKPVSKPAPQKPVGIGVFTWLFSPAAKFSWGKFIARIALFVIGFIAATSLFMALSVKLQMVLAGMPLDYATFGTRLAVFPAMMIAMLRVNPFAFILFILFLVIVGGFIFMPRQKICRYGFLATNWTSLFWMVIAGGAVTAIAFSGMGYASWLISIVAAIAILGGLCAWVSTARFASTLRISNWALLLSFPFGFIMYTLIGYFMPVNDAGDTEITVQYKWYNRLINFLSGTKSGLIVLGLLQILILCLVSMPGSWILAIVFAVLWATIGAARILRNVKTLSWLATIINLITIIGIVLVVELFPYQLIQIAMS